MLSRLLASYFTLPLLLYALEGKLIPTFGSNYYEIKTPQEIQSMRNACKLAKEILTYAGK